MADLSFLSGLGGLFGGIGSVIAGNSQNKTNLKIARETNQAQMDLAKYQADRNYELWQHNNEYNTPVAQMQRYQEAGLNPNLIYGNGSASAGNSASPAQGFDAPRLIAPKVDNSYIANATQLFMQGLNQVAAYKKASSETALNYQNLSNLQKDNEIKELIRIHQEYENAKTKEEKDLWYDLLQSRLLNQNSQTVSNLANAELSDSNRFTNNALRYLLVQEKTAMVNNILADTVNKEDFHKLNDYRRQQLVADIARIQSQDSLNGSLKSESEMRTQIKGILHKHGLNIENDELDRLLYQLMQSGASDLEITTLKGLGRTATLTGRALGK